MNALDQLEALARHYRDLSDKWASVGPSTTKTWDTVLALVEKARDEAGRTEGDEVGVPVPDAAAANGYTPAALYLWIRQGILPAERRGGGRNTRVKPSDVAAIVNARSTTNGSWSP